MSTSIRKGLTNAVLTRRDFLRGSGALVVTFSLGPAFQRVGAQGINGNPATNLDAWIGIAADGTVTAYTGKCELGQGLTTAQIQLVAEELGVPIDRVRLVQCDTSRTPDQGTTSGQQSHPANFNHANLALAAATAREALVGLASQRLGIPAGQLTVEDGVVVARVPPDVGRVLSDPPRRLTYGELVGGRRFELSLNPDARRKPAGEWKTLGTSVPRVDLPALVTGQQEFVHNVRVPGMLHGQVVRPPGPGATVARVDQASVQGMAGLVRVVVKGNFVGVIAEKPWQAVQAAAKLAVTWIPGQPLPAQREMAAFLRRQPARDTLLVDSGDVEATLVRAPVVVRATYAFPYQMHGSVGSSCAVADVQGGAGPGARATIWSASQAVHPLKASAAAVLGMPADNVRVIFTRGSGCYGINGADTVSYDAALLSQAVGRPVRVQLTRRDEMAWENYGIPFVIDQRAGVDASGRIIAWDYEAWSAATGGRPGAQNPGNVVTGTLAGFRPAAFTPRTPAPAPDVPLNNNLNTAPSYIAGRAGGAARGAGVVASERVLSHRIASPFFTGPLRSPERLQNTLAHECFMDEIAARIGADPVAFRLRHLSHVRLKAALDAAAKAAGWQPRPSPAGAASPVGAASSPVGATSSLVGAAFRRPASGVASGRGVACVAYEGDNGFVAMVADVDVTLATGAVRVTRLVIAQDSGPVSNPDGLRNQLEGGAIHGISRALVEEVSWDAQKVTSVDWRTYPTLTLGFEAPSIETVLINNLNEEACGAGETAITIVAAAIGNAIFDATGARLRQVPFTPARVLAALPQ